MYEAGRAVTRTLIVVLVRGGDSLDESFRPQSPTTLLGTESWRSLAWKTFVSRRTVAGTRSDGPIVPTDTGSTTPRHGEP
jgi:NAD kinase